MKNYPVYGRGKLERRTQRQVFHYQGTTFQHEQLGMGCDAYGEGISATTLRNFFGRDPQKRASWPFRSPPTLLPVLQGATLMPIMKANFSRQISHVHDELSTCYTSLMKFDWDPVKAAENVVNHNVSFEEAQSIFGDLLATTITDPDHSVGEERFLTTGLSLQQRLIIVWHTEEEDTIRIIGAREVTPYERRVYESGE